MTSGSKKTANDQTIFEILAHPLRRRILEEIHNRGEVSYSIFTEEMGLQAGTLYHHLRLMRELIEQEPNKKYRLTPKGARAIELVHSSEGALVSELKPAPIPSLKVFSPLFRSFADNPTRSFVEGVIVILSFLWFVVSIGAVVFGPFLLAGSGLKSHEVILLGLGSWSLCAITLELLARKVYGRQKNTLALATACSLIFVLPGVLGVLVFLLTRLELLESISSGTLLLVEVGAQIWSVLVISAAISQLKQLSWERATLLALIVNYLLLAIVLVLVSLNTIG